LPPFLCTCEHWGLDAEFLDCMQTAGDMKLPFLCEADNVLNLRTFMAPRSPVRIRESSFLQNPRLSPAVKASVATVTIGGGGERGATAAATAQVPGNQTEAELQDALRSLEGYRVLHLSSVHGLLAPGTAPTASLRSVEPGQYCCQRPDKNGQGNVMYAKTGVWEAWEAWPAEPGTLGRESHLSAELMAERFQRVQAAEDVRAPSDTPHVTFPVQAAPFCETRGYRAFLRPANRLPFDRNKACPAAPAPP